MKLAEVRETAADFYLKIVDRSSYFQILVIGALLKKFALDASDYGEDGAECILKIARLAVADLEIDLLSCRMDLPEEEGASG
ncbi:hypothetical protein [Gluconobacter oxydans]|uniref:hypothetical protein n=1 Tax=Gluconobacter oxydans TaxID=442 RepID=UPI00059DD7E1|nr:hypothetical protein [Gluconobacter oxydans]